ncbi:MAG TPA: UDP-N-acetylmuramoyl-L-alanyl-D-glutamate--2,6-diaminopimelate ligase [Chitinophagaceae bacterium]|nr:UDP-N-acetylmuramoyl-L-alanyl-D-glutamate--2,6-diaminopimelate ligase [Chitinophagaceae bacterium]
MKHLNDIVSSIHVLQCIGEPNIPIQGISLNSSEVASGYLFIAVKGHSNDGHHHIPAAIHHGATAILCTTLPSTIQEGITYIQTDNSRFACGVIASAFYNHPSQSMQIVGITGTNGKTTCATLLYKLFSALGYTCGLISTVQNQIGEQVLPSTHTTPDAIRLQQLFSAMKEQGCRYVFMEVSSHAIHQQRIAGTIFAGACFTNITHDHLDYHKTFDEYIAVKKSFFDQLPSSAFALSNADDKRGAVMLQNTKAHKAMYSLRTLADYKGRILENSLRGLHMHINQQEVYFKLIGEFNASNLLCVSGAANLLGVPLSDVLVILSGLEGAEGRFDTLKSEKQHVMGVIDYAHTPDALLNVLATLKALRSGEEKLFTVIGCGGNRDTAKRPLMGLVACEHSDHVVFTSDNPRNEDALQIIHEMEQGVSVHQQKKYISIPDRKEAIKTACTMAQQGDIILLAGKGHEKYQEVNGVKIPFDDKKILHEMFLLLEK